MLQWEVAKVKSLMNFDMTLTVVNLQQKRPKGATTKIQVKRIKRDIRIIIKRPARDVCLYMGEVNLLDPPDPPDPHFLFAIALQP